MDDGYKKFRGVLSSYVQDLVDQRAAYERAERQVRRESLDGKLSKLFGRETELTAYSVTQN